MVDVISRYTTLKEKGNRWWGCCPFHREKTPSFSVTPEKKIYYCFGCQKGGNLFQFIRDIENLSFTEAVLFLARRNGIELEGHNDSPEENREKTTLLDLYRKMTAGFRYILEQKPEGLSARNYLESRGIHRETARTFHLGLAPFDRYWIHRFLTKKNYSEEFLRKSGFFSSRYPKISLFSGRLMFPLFTVNGHPVAFSGRLLAGDGPKYINSPDSLIFHKKHLLFGLGITLDFIKAEKHCILCEGNLDVLALYQVGVKNCVAPLGTAFTPEQAKLIKRYASRVTIAFDGDQAGRTAAVKSASVCENAGLEVFIAELPEGKDPADLIQEENREILIKKIKKAQSAFEYFLKICNIRHNSFSLPAEKEKAIGELFPYIRSVQSSLRQGIYLNMLAESAGLPTETLRKNFLEGIPLSRREERTATPPDPRISDELYLILAVLSNPETEDLLRDFVFSDEQASRIKEEILEKREKNRDIDLNRLLTDLHDPALENLILKKISSSEFEEQGEQIVRMTLERIRMKRLYRKRKELNGLIKQYQRDEKNPSLINELLAEAIRLDKEIETKRKEELNIYE